VTPALQDKSQPYELMAEIAELFGQDVADKLMLNFPGVTLYVPETLKDGHRILDALGREDGEAFCAHYSSSRLAIPTGKQRAAAANAKEMTARARELEASGMSKPDIAMHLGVSERRVYQLLAGTKADPRQGDIFLGWVEGMAPPPADNDA